MQEKHYQITVIKDNKQIKCLKCKSFNVSELVVIQFDSKQIMFCCFDCQTEVTQLLNIKQKKFVITQAIVNNKLNELIVPSSIFYDSSCVQGKVHVNVLEIQHTLNKLLIINPNVTQDLKDYQYVNGEQYLEQDKPKYQDLFGKPLMLEYHCYEQQAMAMKQVVQIVKCCKDMLTFKFDSKTMKDSNIYTLIQQQQQDVCQEFFLYQVNGVVNVRLTNIFNSKESFHIANFNSVMLRRFKSLLGCINHNMNDSFYNVITCNWSKMRNLQDVIAQKEYHINDVKTIVETNTDISNYLDSAVQLQIVAKTDIDMLLNNLEQFNLPKPDKSQLAAINYAIHHPLTLIQGSFGGGKSLTLSYIGYLLSIQNKILVCTATNAAADNIFGYFQQLGLKSIRVYSTVLESSDFPKKSPNLSDYNKEDDISMVLSKFKLVVCTSSTSSEKRLKNIQFDVLLIDEACQMLELETILALQHNVKQLVMVGDPCQLGPQLHLQKLRLCNYNITLFERLQYLGVSALLLNVQYRMSDQLAEYANTMYYNHRLKSARSMINCTYTGEQLNQIFNSYPLVFMNCNGSELLDKSSGSISNRSSFNEGIRLVNLLLEEISNDKVVVLTPYAQQQKLYVNAGINILIQTVDGFQGSEADYIILDTVRSHEKGFLSDKRRMNVAMTRAKTALIVIGSSKVFPELSNFCKERHCYYESNE